MGADFLRLFGLGIDKLRPAFTDNIMAEIKDIEWFKKEIAPHLTGYELKYRFYEKGDFGSLSQVMFESVKIGGSIDFWGLDWLGISVFSYETEDVLLNVLFETGHHDEKEKGFKRLQELLL